MKSPAQAFHQQTKQKKLIGYSTTVNSVTPTMVFTIIIQFIQNTNKKNANEKKKIQIFNAPFLVNGINIFLEGEF